MFALVLALGLFVAASAMFYFAPRVVAALCVLALSFSDVDPLSVIGIGSTQRLPVGTENPNVVSAILALVVLLWLIPGAFADALAARRRLAVLRGHLKVVTGSPSPSGPYL